MTVQKNLVKNIYIGNASATKFAITFDIPESHPEYLRVYIGSGSNVEETKNYTADLKAKTITYPKSGEPLPAGQKIIIMRELPLSQLLDLVNQGNYYAEDVEDALDILTLISQQISEKLSRALVFNVDIDTSMFDNIIPFEAGKNFRVSDDGTHIETTEDPAKVIPIAESLLAQTTQQASIAIQQAAAAAGSALSAADSEVNAETAMTQARASAALSQKWADSAESPDGQEDADSPTGDTMSAKEWALYAKDLIQQINPDKIVTGVTLINGSVNVEKGDGTSDSFDVVTSVNGMKPKNGNVDVAGIPVGFEFFTLNPEAETGVLQYLGGEYSRETYKDLWKVISKQTKRIISESEWQEKAAANNGNVQFYSTGDGSTTFRVPSVKCWVKGATETGEIGKYLPAGMPNVKGSAKIHGNSGINYPFGVGDTGGAFYTEQKSFTMGGNYGDSTKTSGDAILLDASRSSSVYGNADTVQPESIVGVWCVKAFGTVSNIGNQDVTELSAEVTRLGTRVNEITNSVNNISDMEDYVIETYQDGTSWYRLYKSGWVVQGGKQENQKEVTLLKPMQNTNYDIKINVQFTASSNVGYESILKDTITTTGFQFRIIAAGLQQQWRVEGYAE